MVSLANIERILAVLAFLIYWLEHILNRLPTFIVPCSTNSCYLFKTYGTDGIEIESGLLGFSFQREVVSKSQRNMVTIVHNDV